eukprot:998624_1
MYTAITKDTFLSICDAIGSELRNPYITADHFLIFVCGHGSSDAAGRYLLLSDGTKQYFKDIISTFGNDSMFSTTAQRRQRLLTFHACAGHKVFEEVMTTMAQSQLASFNLAQLNESVNAYDEVDAASYSSRENIVIIMPTKLHFQSFGMKNTGNPPVVACVGELLIAKDDKGITIHELAQTMVSRCRVITSLVAKARVDAFILSGAAPVHRNPMHFVPIDSDQPPESIWTEKQQRLKGKVYRLLAAAWHKLENDKKAQMELRTYIETGLKKDLPSPYWRQRYMQISQGQYAGKMPTKILLHRLAQSFDKLSIGWIQRLKAVPT